MLRGLAFALLLIGLSLTANETAARDSQRQDYGMRGQAQQNCRDIHLRKGVLVGECLQKDGRWQLTRLQDLDECRAKQEREDNLSCLNRFGIPRGSYLESCREVEVDGEDLRAKCQRRSGSWRSSKLENFASCKGDIRNRNGRLSC